MLIVADENLPLLDEFFGHLGTLRRCPGRTLSTRDLAGVDLLLVRSVTRVDAHLLGRERPRFVGSATIGTDHVDIGWLAGEGIPFAAAPGCNARAVAEYIATVLALHREERLSAGSGLAGACLGVVGCGNVGREVVAIGQAFGMNVVVADPFLGAGQLPAGAVLRSLDELLAVADVVTLHVPLTKAGTAPTRHLLDARRLEEGRWRLLINTARGAVVDNRALHALLARQHDRRVVLDVWEEEPRVPGALLGQVWMGTPHVAGYTSEGKWRGTAQVYRAACSALGMDPVTDLARVLTDRGDGIVDIRWPGSLSGLLSSVCPIVPDTARLQAALNNEGEVPAAAFDALRRDYPERREFSHFRVRGVPAASRVQTETKTPQETAALLERLGFGVAD